jgi:polar amino acid transport system substrate-binding protein
LIFALGLLLGGCGGEKKVEQKVLRVGTEPTFAPFEFQKEGSKEYTVLTWTLPELLASSLT